MIITKRRHVLAYVVILILLVALANVVFEIAKVDVRSASMMPTLYPGDFFVAIRFAPLRRYNIAVIDDPIVPSQVLVKRIVGLPGEFIQMRHGHVFIDGQEAVEQYLGREYRSQENEPVKKPFKIPSEYYYVLGDNRPFSRDSRGFGPVHQSAIRERVIAVIYPWEHRKIFWLY